MISATTIRDEAKSALQDFERGDTQSFNAKAAGLVDQILSPEFDRFRESTKKLGFHLDSQTPIDPRELYGLFHTEMLLSLAVPYDFCLSYYRNGPGTKELHRKMIVLHGAMQIIAERSEYIDSQFHHK